MNITSILNSASRSFRRKLIVTSRVGQHRLQARLSWFPILGLLLPGAVFGQGALTNGFTHQGAISPVGDADSWTFSATTGDRIIIRVGEITQTGSFNPRIRLQNPSAVQIASAQNATAAEIAVTATNTGTFTLIVDDAGGVATGTYRLTLAKSPGDIFVAPGDEGGPLTNGVTYEGNNLPPGDLDVWSFSANAGDSFVIKAGQMSDTNNFDPWIRVYGPDGVLLGSAADAASAEVSLRATNSGTFLVVVATDFYYSTAASGTYRLTLAKTGSAIVVAAGDEGGPLTNAVAHQGNMPLGDLDAWSFSANSGESIVLKVGQVTDVGNFDPWVRLYGPDGVLIGSDDAGSAAEVAIRATNSGTFLVLIGNHPYYSDAASGSYLLTLAKTGDPIMVSPGDEGGPLTNAVTHQGIMPLGDLDLWNFTAIAGESVVVKVGQITDVGNFDPWVRLYGPDGALLGSVQDGAAAEVAIRATNSGAFLVVIGNYPYYSDASSGTYLLTLAKTGGPIVVAPGDEGGSLTGASVYNGNIPIGDLDLWTFTICAGQFIAVRADELTQTNSFAPWVRLYGPNGVMIGSGWDAAFGEVALTTTNSGTFLVVIGNNDYYNNSGSGAYQLTVNGLSDGLKLCNPIILGANTRLGGVGGVSNATYVLFTQTNVTASSNLWTPIRTNQFDTFGVFSFTNAYNPGELQRYFRLKIP